MHEKNAVKLKIKVSLSHSYASTERGTLKNNGWLESRDGRRLMERKFHAWKICEHEN